jgi:DNA repair protein RadA/Sms
MQGKCFECGSWGTLIEEIIEAPSKSAVATSSARVGASRPVRLSEITRLHEERISTGIAEFDRVLGGGLMDSSVVLIGGEPGIGKSTLMLQILPFLTGKKIIYISAEESIHQIKSRAERMKITSENLYLVSETELESILAIFEIEKPNIVIIDSIQTIFSSQFESAAGSVSQVRECTARLTQASKRQGFTTFVIGHITKDGTIAGPKVLEHIVDTVLQFEGDSNYRYRILRALKNRFGSTNEIGVFEMDEDGLQEVKNPSEIFIAERSFGVSGSVVASIMEGSRPLLVEVQALVSQTTYSVPQRVASGFDARRLSLLLAVLEKRIGLRVSMQDVFLNIAGGLRIDEPAADLGVVVAIASGFRDTPADSGTIAIGEVGLGGELRAVSHIERRLAEARKLGFEKAVVPKSNFRDNPKLSEKKFGLEVAAVTRLSDALAEFLQ